MASRRIAISTIATISADTGIAKEVLRKWEARYGFPVPQRDGAGYRVYTDAQTARLKLIKQLIDAGMRPGQVVPLDEAQLQALLTQRQTALSPRSRSPAMADLMKSVLSRNAGLLRKKLKEELRRLRLEKFVLNVMPPLTELVGDAWASGDISIRDEHLYTEIVQGLMREEIVRIANPNGSPRVLLTTPTDELHTLGILMVEAVVSLHGGCCISLGAQTPTQEIGEAVREHGADIAGLSFSASFPKRKIAPILQELRALLPKEIELWAGGAGAAALDRTPRGVTVLPNLQDVVDALQKFTMPHQRVEHG
jgi:MerR family transcriptional regulator, light-induced transcriptional regulator